MHKVSWERMSKNKLLSLKTNIKQKENQTALENINISKDRIEPGVSQPDLT
jgi:hypothetical protein